MKPTTSRANGRAALRPRWLLSLSAIALVASTQVLAQTPSDCVLAQRFRPYVKMSKGQGSGEPYRPANWDWVVKQSSLKQGNKTLVSPVSSGGWSSDYHELLANGGDLTKNPNDASLELGVPSAIYSGEPWSDAIHQGHGIYAHVEHISSTLVNIEYYILYAYNEPPGVPSQAHSGDLTTMVVEFDTSAQLISRVVYTAHGCLMQLDQMRAGQTAAYGVLAGSDENMKPTETRVAQVNADTANDHKNPCTLGFTAASDPHFYLAADPYTHVYQHPAVYVEVGDHEMWPNASGYLSFEGGHDGTDVSFVPDVIQLLGDVDNPAPRQTSFVRYNGKFGSDPAAVALHKAWCWVASPQDADSGPACQVSRPLGLADSRFADMDPYRQIGSQPWPPPAYDAGIADVYVAPGNFGDSGVGTQQKPIPDFRLAYSVVAAGRTLHLQSGQYGGNIILSKPMTLTSQGGAVTIGGAVGASPAGTAASEEQVCRVTP
jgi:hypothetical protein